SIKLAGTCRLVSSCRPTSPSLRCRQNAPSSTRSKTSGSSCATTGSRTASSNPTTISSTIAATPGTSSSISPGASCPSDCANGRTGFDQWDLVLQVQAHRNPYFIGITSVTRGCACNSPSLVQDFVTGWPFFGHGVAWGRGLFRTIKPICLFLLPFGAATLTPEWPLNWRAGYCVRFNDWRVGASIDSICTWHGLHRWRGRVCPGVLAAG